VETFRKVGTVYRKRGPRGVVEAVRGRFGLQPDFQAKEGLAERLALLDPAVPADTRSLIDVGCNIGRITSHFASRGIFSLGIDIGQGQIDRAVKLHRGQPNLAFAVMNLTPDNIDTVPQVDCLLILSVHHNWVQLYGPDGAGEMLRALCGRARKSVVYEAPARGRRYGEEHRPDFIDNDEASVTAYHEAYLAKHVADDFSRVVALGKSPCWGEGTVEPYRYSWGLYRD